MILLRSSYPIALAAVVFASGCASAFAADVNLDNLAFPTKDGGKATIKHVEFDGTNLSQDEVATLFSASATREMRAPIIAKLQATKILIPVVVVTDKDQTGTITFRDFQASGVNAGKVDHLTLAGFDGSGTIPDLGPATMHSDAIAIDGSDFSRLLPALRDGDLAGAGNSKINHLSWQGFSMTFPDKDTPASAPGGNLYKIAIASVEGQATYTGDYPVRGSGMLKDLTIEPPKASAFGQSLVAFGYDKIDIGLTIDGTYDPGAGTYAIDDYTISGANAGTFDFKAQLGGIDKSAFTGDRKMRLAALANGNVSSAAVSFADKGLFAKAVAFVAKTQKKTQTEVKQQWSAIATQLLPALLGGDPSSLKLATAVNKFIAAPGTLTVSVKAKGNPISFSEIMEMAPAALMQHIDLDASPQ
jgi:hypothetical protein